MAPIESRWHRRGTTPQSGLTARRLRGEMESEDTLGPRVGFYYNIWNGETGVECLMWPGLVNMMYNNVTSNGPSEIKIFPKFMINFWHFWDNLWNLAKYKFLQYLPCFSPLNLNKRQQTLRANIKIFTVKTYICFLVGWRVDQGGESGTHTKTDFHWRCQVLVTSSSGKINN